MTKRQITWNNNEPFRYEVVGDGVDARFAVEAGNGSIVQEHQTGHLVHSEGLWRNRHTRERGMKVK